MERIQPWNTTIGKFSVVGECDLDEIAAEIMANCSMENGSHVPFDRNRPLPPVLQDLVTRLIQPQVFEYIETEFGLKVLPEDWDFINSASFCVNIKDGSELETHLHGLSSLTVVMYPWDAQSMLVCNDPRGNACRGYPRRVRDTTFGNHRIIPQAGDVYILPSYIQHAVTSVKDEFRLSFVTDYFISGQI